VADIGWAVCPVCTAVVPGYVVPWPVGGRFVVAAAVKPGAHPSPYGPGPCIGTGEAAQPVPLPAPAVAYGLALQRETEPLQGTLF